MKPKRFLTKGFCKLCQKPVDKVEVWVTSPYKTIGVDGAEDRFEGGAHAIAMCHGRRDERTLDFGIGSLLSMKMISKIREPFFDAEFTPFIPSCDRPRLTKKPVCSRHTPTEAEKARAEYEHWFSPLPKPRKRTLRERDEQRERDLAEGKRRHYTRADRITILKQRTD